MGSKWDSESAVVACLCALIKAGSSVWVAAVAVELPYLVVYRLARAFGLPIRQVKRVSPAESDKIAQLRLKGLAPMDIVCELSVGSSVVYRIGIELGLWHRNEHRRTAKATIRRCEYLQLRAHGLGRNDTAAVCGIHPRVAADIDKGACQVGNRAQAFRAPTGWMWHCITGLCRSFLMLTAVKRFPSRLSRRSVSISGFHWGICPWRIARSSSI